MIDITNEDTEVFGSKTTDEYCKRVMGAVQKCQKSSSSLQGWYHYGDYRGVQKTMSRVNLLLHKVISKVYIHQDININLQGHGLREQLDVLREGNDALLERINSDVDEASGLRRNPDIEMFDSTVRTMRAPTHEESGRGLVLLASRNVQKPQMFFEKKVNNSAKEPYIPIITEKPNSLKPLAILPCIDENGREFYGHPYEYELQRWSPSESAFECHEPIKPSFISDTPLSFIANEQTLHDMIEELRDVSEVAVDVEHHSFRTYLGLTCLIQVSSRSKDYIIDTLALRGKLTPLNQIFANPKLIKIFHGADYDILWLQRDCGLYVVNMFDTHQAAIILELPHRSLAALLNKYCDIHANKSYQRADWRIRPLPGDFVAYAQQDSHYLCYIFDLLRNELIEKGNELHNLITACYARSTEICLQRYEKPFVGPESHLPLYRRSRKCFNSRQMHGLKDIYFWRDKVAREQDESVEYILPKHMMLQISEVLPKEMQGILGCCNPIPLFVKTDQLTLHQIIRNAKEQPLKELSVTLNHELCGNTAEYDDISQLLFSKHDLSLLEDTSTTGLSTLLNPQETLVGDLFSSNYVNVRTKPTSELFGMKEVYNKRSKYLYNKTTEFQSPFERYLLYIKLQPELAEQANEKEKRDNDRVEKLREHFLSLNKLESVQNPSNVQEGDEEDDVEKEASRINRLLSHIASIVPRSQGSLEQEERISKSPEVDDSVSESCRIERLLSHVASCVPKPDMNSIHSERPNKGQSTKKNKKVSMLDRIKDIRIAEEKKQQDDSKRRAGKVGSNNKGKKRKSQETDSSNKKRKSKDNSAVENKESSNFGNERNEDASTELDVDIEPFDYSTADYNIFKKGKKRDQSKKIREKFKRKGVRGGSTGASKSGIKSGTWSAKD